ncbi:MAG: hypothetical protein AAFX90_10295 [Pseudomonadota bacterium]
MTPETKTAAEYITLPDAVIRYSLSESTIRRRKDEGLISFYKPCGRTLLKVSEMDQLMQNSRV